MLIATLGQALQDGCFARGIAVVDVNKITDEELYQMHSVGVRGLRLNMQSHGKEVKIHQLKLRMQAAAARIQHLPGWKLQLFVPAHVWNGKLPAVVVPKVILTFPQTYTRLFSAFLYLSLQIIWVVSGVLQNFPDTCHKHRRFRRALPPS